MNKRTVITLIGCALAWAMVAQPHVEVISKTVKTAGGQTIEADFGALTVPENRLKPGSRTLKLAFVRLKSKAVNPAPPLVYLEGGPGGSSTHLAENPRALQAWAAVLEIGDLIFLDQRGTGKSEPNLRYTFKSPTPEMIFMDESVALQYFQAAIGEAAVHFKEEGIDLDGYNTAESADDIDDLRRALGFEKIRLFGFSYGTHLAMATIKRHGGNIDRAVLIGTEGLHQTHKLPLNLDAQFGKISLIAAKDSEINREIPDLTALLKSVLDQLDKNPMEVEIRSAEGAPVKVKIGRFGLLYLLRRDIGDASDLPAFPRLLYSISKGDPSVLQWFVRKRWPGNMFNLMPILVDGASGASAERWEMIRAQTGQSLFGNSANFPWPEIDDATRVKILPESFRSPLVSDVPVLFLSGSLDWNAPPFQAEEVRFGLSNAIHLVVENAGHEQILPQSEVQAAILQFLQGKEIECTRVTLPPIQFVPLNGHDPNRTHPSVSN